MFLSVKNFFRLKYWIRLVGFIGWTMPIYKILGFNGLKKFFENIFGIEYGSNFSESIIFISLLIIGFFFRNIYRAKIQGIENIENIEEIKLKEWIYSKQNSYYIIGVFLYIFAL